MPGFWRIYLSERMKGDAPSMWYILVRSVRGMSGGFRDLCHLCAHSEPDFGE